MGSSGILRDRYRVQTLDAHHSLTALQWKGYECVEPYLLCRMQLHGATLIPAQSQCYIYFTFGCAIYKSDIL